MISLDNIRIRRRRLDRCTRTRTPFPFLVHTATRRSSSLLWLVLVQHTALLLSWKLATRRLTPLPHGAVVSRARSGLLVRNDIVCGAPVWTSAALSVGGDLVVCVVRIGVLQDHVPGVEEAGEKTETAEGEVDERVGAAETFLDPYYCKC